MRSCSITASVFFLLLYSYCGAQIPQGYYDPAAGLSGAQLKTALHRIVRGHIHRTYDNLWMDFYTTDDKPNGKVWDIYSNVPDGTPNGNPPYVFCFGPLPCHQCSTTPGTEGICYNREHTFPKSWWGGGTAATDSMYTDLFHLYPADSKVNTMRNDNPYGEVDFPTFTSLNGSKLGACSFPGFTGTVFEPLDSVKGDVARNYFYMATRYENEIASWAILTPEANSVLDGTSYPCFETWYVQLLLSWSSLDPVSQKEIDRNNAVYAIQHNRNPFIDHPEYINAIWGGGTPGPSAEPTNYPSDFSAHAIHLQWTDATGTVAPTGYLIRMSAAGFSSISSPADGVPVANSTTDLNVAQGVQSAWFTNLIPATTYYFKLFGYTGSGSGIDYKTDGTIPQLQQTSGN